MRNYYTLLFTLFCCSASWAQTDNLMFVEYVDWTSGDGLGLTIYNPTNADITLDDYAINVHNNGNMNPNSAGALFGNLPAGETIRVSNGSYSNVCIGSPELIITVGGVNDQDVITLVQNGEVIDAIGALGYTGNYQLNGVVIPQSLKWVKLVRNADNCVRYTESDGNSLNSWPTSQAVNFTGWTAVPVTCLDPAVDFDISSPQLALDTAICAGDSVYFSGDWYSTSGFYTTVISGDFGCDSLLTLDLTINPVDTIYVEATICFGDSIFLSGQWQTEAGIYPDTIIQEFGCPQIVQTILDLPSAETIEVAHTLCPGETYSIGNHVFSEPGVYSVSIDIPDNACFETYLVSISQSVYTYENLEITACDSVEYNGIYYSESVVLVDTIPDLNGCLTRIQEWRIIIDPPELEITGPSGICPDEPAFLEVTGTSEPTWSTGDTGYSLIVTPTIGTWYYATIETPGCSITDSIFVEVSNLSLNIPDTAVIEYGESIRPGFTFSGNAYTLEWTPIDGLEMENPYNPVFSPESSTLYTLTASDIYGCAVVDSIFIKVLMPEFQIPNIITPNGDGYNDVFIVADLPSNNELRIFNRWGQEVFAAAPYRNDWNASIGSDSPVEGHYTYILRIRLGLDNLEYTGMISVVGVN